MIDLCPAAADQDTLVECSTFADSLCGNKTVPVVTSTPTPAEPPGELTCSLSPHQEVQPIFQHILRGSLIDLLLLLLLLLLLHSLCS